MSSGLHSLCQGEGGELHGFYVPLVDFPTCARFDVSIQCIGRSLWILSSAFAVIEPSGTRSLASACGLHDGWRQEAGLIDEL